MKCEIDIVDAVMPPLYRTATMKREPSLKVEFSIDQWLHVLTRDHGHEHGLETERFRS